MKITVETDHLLTLSDVARRFDVGRSTVSMWDNRREQNGFPAPLIQTPGGTRLWLLEDVERWEAS